MNNDIDLSFALLALDPFGYGLPDAWFGCEFDVPLADVVDAIRNYYFIDS